MAALWDVTVVADLSARLMIEIVINVSTAVALDILKISVEIFMTTHQICLLVLFHVVDLVITDEVVVLANKDLVPTQLLPHPQSYLL